MSEADRSDAVCGGELERDLNRLEREFYRIYADAPGELDTMLARARASGDRAMLARSLCLVGRALIGRGQHEAALATARAGLAAFDELEPVADVHLAARAELLRTAGNALLKLGRNGDALPLLEQAVRAAERAVARRDVSPAELRHGQHALIRSSSNLGSALFAVRELDTAIALYERAASVTGAAGASGADDGMLDDVLLAQWNLADALHERVRQKRAAGDEAGAEADLRSVQVLLERAAEQLADGSERAPCVTGYGRQGYYASLGQHLLLTGRPARALEMFDRQAGAIAHEPRSGMYDWVVGLAHSGMAHAAIALGLPRDALRHSDVALAHFDRHDEVGERAPVLLVRAQALRALRDYETAYAQLEAYHALRARLEAEAAQQYAVHLSTKFGLERARAETESHRRIAATVEALGQIGQEITANLDVDAVVQMLHRHITALLPAPGLAVWLVEPGGERLTLALGVKDGRALRSMSIRLDHPTAQSARAVRERREIAGRARDPAEPPNPITGLRVMQSVLFAPLILGDRTLGVVSIQSDRPTAYDENERSILRTLCAYGAIALDNAAAYRELARAVSRLEATQHELSIRTAEYERLSLTDSLTGIANRRHFLERAGIEVAEARRNGGELGVAMFDLDLFKQVNDQYGHVVGDAVLQQLAHVAKEGLRSADFIARVGGEEFALLLPGAGSAEAIAIAERIRAAIEKFIVRAGEVDIRVTASFGLTNFTVADEDFDAALARADGALYRAKQAGRNRVHATPQT